MKKGNALLIVLFLMMSIMGTAQSKTKIEIKDNWYYLNGEKYFIKALGYEIGARPGQSPYHEIKSDNLDLMKFDMNVIKDAGYNAIRTWSQFSEPQLKLIQDSGLKLIMGINVDPDKDYGNPQFIKECDENLQNVLNYSKKYDCIIR